MVTQLMLILIQVLILPTLKESVLQEQTPESRTTDKKEKVLGLEVKQRLKDILTNASIVVIRTQKPDSTEKYGRVLGWLFVDGAEKSVNEALIADGYAWGYMGETKIKDFALLEAKRKQSGK